MSSWSCWEAVFQSTPSVWRATLLLGVALHADEFQSTPSVWRATASVVPGSTVNLFQSTPSVWRATTRRASTTRPRQFQSTPSVWRATARHAQRGRDPRNFNPRPPCGGRHPYPHMLYRRDPISIHALRVEGDSAETGQTWWASISIHALRVEGDPLARCPPRPSANFNPRPPCGGRPSRVSSIGFTTSFQSTPSVWRATGTSDHVGLVEEFQSTPSVWRATMASGSRSRVEKFQSTPSVWRATYAVRYHM